MFFIFNAIDEHKDYPNVVLLKENRNILALDVAVLKSNFTQNNKLYTIRRRAQAQH